MMDLHSGFAHLLYFARFHATGQRTNELPGKTSAAHPAGADGSVSTFAACIPFFTV
jgi:hypothetical protein